MITKSIEMMPIMETIHGVDARGLYNSPELVVTVITLQPGERLKRHITPVDVAFFVLEGTGFVEIGEERSSISAGTLVESPKDVLHCWYNESDQRLRFMVIKAPRPKTKAILVDD
ncbi:cupin domain-containing protein [Candidatus Bipolaricaulota bacterium]|nr:cupin domain-containing protein [Candidatus Bipolaricaulota bacterium]